MRGFMERAWEKSNKEIIEDVACKSEAVGSLY